MINGTIMRVIIVVLIFALIIFPISFYLYVTKIDTWRACMVNYINFYYPYWATYLINWTDRHIDKRTLYWANTNKIDDVDWCLFTQDVATFISNTPYCYMALVIEKWIFWNEKKELY